MIAETENPPAFPTAQFINVPAGHYWTQPTPSEGMTLRQYFDAKALNGLLSNGQLTGKIWDYFESNGASEMECRNGLQDTIVRMATEYTDAMLAARSKPVEDKDQTKLFKEE